MEELLARLDLDDLGSNENQVDERFDSERNLNKLKNKVLASPRKDLMAVEGFELYSHQDRFGEEEEL